MNLNATLFAQFVVFFTLVWFVMKFIWPPMIKALDERRAKIADGLKAAEDSVAEKLEADSQVKVLLKDAKQEASTIVTLAQKRAEETVEASKTQAKEVADKQLQNAQEQILVETNQAKEKLRQEVVALALEGASKIVGKEVDRATHESMLKDLASRL